MSPARFAEQRVNAFARLSRQR